MNDDDWSFKKKDGPEIIVGEDLEGHSIESLDERLTMLVAEVGRVKQMKIKKTSQAGLAADLFSSGGEKS